MQTPALLHDKVKKIVQKFGGYKNMLYICSVKY